MYNETTSTWKKYNYQKYMKNLLIFWSLMVQHQDIMRHFRVILMSEDMAHYVSSYDNLQEASHFLSLK